MEPLNDGELQQLLRTWKAPAAPPTLEERVFSSPKSGWKWLWKWLWTGTFRVPVPLAVAAALLLALWIHYSKASNPPPVTQPGTVSLADFKPVRQLQPVVVVGGTK
jgi:hypothetical protein